MPPRPDGSTPALPGRMLGGRGSDQEQKRPATTGSGALRSKAAANIALFAIGGRSTGGGGTLDQGSFGSALAVCGLVKYKDVPGFTDAQKVEGIFLNITGAKDEHAVIPGGI